MRTRGTGTLRLAPPAHPLTHSPMRHPSDHKQTKLWGFCCPHTVRGSAYPLSWKAEEEFLTLILTAFKCWEQNERGAEDHGGSQGLLRYEWQQIHRGCDLKTRGW